MPPLYKTIVMEMLQDRPSLHEQLRVRRTLLQSMVTVHAPGRSEATG